MSGLNWTVRTNFIFRLWRIKMRSLIFLISSVFFSNASFKFNKLDKIRESTNQCELLFLTSNDSKSIINETFGRNNETEQLCFSKCIYEKAGLINKQGSIDLPSMIPLINNFTLMNSKSEQSEDENTVALNLISICESNSDPKWICLKSVQLFDCLEIAVYLYNYGYMSKEISNEQQEYLKLKNIYIEAIIKFQQFFNLQLTGTPFPVEDMLQMINTPRCGVLDINVKNYRHKRYIPAGQRKWKKQTLTYRIYDYPEKIPSKDIDDEIAEAFHQWSKQMSLKIEQITSGEADIEIRFLKDDHGDKAPFDGPGGVLAHAVRPKAYKGQKSLIHFDSAENWITDKQSGGLPIFHVALHEIGHSLGLRHSNKKESIMWPLYGGEKHNVTLDEDDIQRIQRLYKPSTNTDSSWLSKVKSWWPFFHL